MFKRILLILVPVVLLFGFLILHRSGPPETPFAKATRETIVNSLNTNGKTEPIQWSAIRSERSGAVDKILVERGRSVTQGQLLVQLDTRDSQAELEAAQARIAEAGAQREVLTGGGRISDLAEIESGLATARSTLATAQREYDALQRLAAKNAAPKAEVTAAKETLERAQLQIQALERRRTSLVAAPDRAVADAKVREAQSTANEARRRIEMGQIRSPISGVLYQFDVKPGAYLNPGDLVGAVGRLDQLRVTVYVDEPELGRVAQGMPVTITWDALVGRKWSGSVERVPTQIVPLGTRQVGEVSCVIDNPDQTLIPGTNINAEIRSKVAENAITIPKEAVRREGGDIGVLKLQGDHVVWQSIKPGVTSITRIQVLDGLNEGDAVALPVDRPIKNNDPVKPVIANP